MIRRRPAGGNGNARRKKGRRTTLRAARGANLLVLEGIIMALLMVGAVLIVMDTNRDGKQLAATPEGLESLVADALHVLAGLPDEDERYGGVFLNKAVAAAASGDPSLLEGKLKRMLPPGADFNVYLNNGHASRDLLRTRAPSGERVSATLQIVPEWTFSYLVPDFGVVGTAATSVDATVVPVFHGRLLSDAALVTNGGFETDADVDGVPDRWVDDGTATVSLAIDMGDTAWQIARPNDGRGGYYEPSIPADSGAGFHVHAEMRGASGCVQVRYLDAAGAEVLVDGVATRCLATLSPADLGVYHVFDEDVFLGDAPSLAAVQLEVALLEGGTTWFDEISLEPIAELDFPTAVSVAAREAASDGVYRATAATYDTAVEPATVTLRAETRHRLEGLTGLTAYRTSDAAFLPGDWVAIQAGLDASTLTLDAAGVATGETLGMAYDFEPLRDALVAEGISLSDAVVTIRVYEPLATPDETMPLATELPQSAGVWGGTLDYDQPMSALLGPSLVVATLEADLTQGGDTIEDFTASKVALFESRLYDAASIAPTYRVIVEAWFADWN
ncbi:MAG TPA: hypothetical protein VI997_02500 [Candidatus Thermoplasmatota archaeon]|nr:hypothetical protein [Candidatus Thermoplasmatota archaeon]